MDNFNRLMNDRAYRIESRYDRMRDEMQISKEMAPDMNDKARAYAEIIDNIINDFGISTEYALYTENDHDYLCVPESGCSKPCDDYVYDIQDGFVCVQLDAVSKDCGAMSSGTAGASNARYSDKTQKSITHEMIERIDSDLIDYGFDAVGYNESDRVYWIIDNVYSDELKERIDGAIIPIGVQYELIPHINGKSLLTIRKNQTKKSSEYLGLITYRTGKTALTRIFPDFESADKECNAISWDDSNVDKTEVFTIEQLVEYFGFDADELRATCKSKTKKSIGSYELESLKSDIKAIITSAPNMRIRDSELMNRLMQMPEYGDYIESDFQYAIDALVTTPWRADQYNIYYDGNDLFASTEFIKSEKTKKSKVKKSEDVYSIDGEVIGNCFDIANYVKTNRPDILERIESDYDVDTFDMDSLVDFFVDTFQCFDEYEEYGITYKKP